MRLWERWLRWFEGTVERLARSPLPALDCDESIAALWLRELDRRAEASDTATVGAEEQGIHER